VEIHSWGYRAVFIGAWLLMCLAIIGGLLEYPGDDSWLGILGLLVCVGLMVRASRLGIAVDAGKFHERSWMRNRSFPVDDVKEVRIVAYDGLLTKGSVSRQLCRLELRFKNGRRAELWSVVGWWRTGKLRETANALNQWIQAVERGQEPDVPSN